MAKKISDKKKVEIYEKVFMKINFHRSLSGNASAVEEILKLIDLWAVAHSNPGGKLTAEQLEDSIVNATVKLGDAV